MPRARNIKPGFFMNDALAEIDPLGRLLFAGLWTIADREGRLEDRPRKIKAELLPYDECDCDALLDDLSKHGFIQRYTHEAHGFIQVCNFGRHQNPHQNEAASVIPEPPKYQAEMGIPTTPVQVPEQHQSNRADSLNPLTDSPSLIPSSATARSAHGRGANYPEDFEKFWAQYPNKKAKDRALKAWRSLKPSAELQERMLAAIAQQRMGRDWLKDDGQYIPYPASWINDAGWMNEVTPYTNGRASPAESNLERNLRNLGIDLSEPEPEFDDVFETKGFVRQ
jgi:hypothetical protein